MYGFMFPCYMRGDVFFGTTHISRDNFFAGIKNIFWVKNFFDFFKNSYYFVSIHFTQIWSTNESIIMLGSD